MSTELEYRVVPVTRFIVTRFFMGPNSVGSVSDRGEYNNENVAHEVAYALCKKEHEDLGYDVGDMRIKYPAKDIAVLKADL
jgi:hypothetical protein